MDRTGAIAELRVQAGRAEHTVVRQRLLDLAGEAEAESRADALIAADVRTWAHREGATTGRQRLLEAAGVIEG